MNKKIGLCLAYSKGHTNYGSSLQNFATIKAVQDLGYECEIISYKKQRSLKDIITTAPFMLISGGFRKIVDSFRVKSSLKKHPDYAKGIRVRENAVIQYQNKNFEPLVKTYTGYEELTNGSLNYKTVLVGSDQVWTPLGLYSKYWNLLFVKESVSSVSYASSFGVSDIPFWQIKQTREYLLKMDSVGVRELRAKEIVDSITGKDLAKVVLDPTLLLTPEEWEDHIKDTKIRHNEEYIFCYFLGTNQDARKRALEIKEKTGMKIVFLPHMDEYIAEDNYFGDERLYDVSPVEFVSLIKNASYVCTDSFHGTVFSTIFKRQVLTFYRFNSSSSNSRNSRIDSLFQLFGMQERLFKEGMDAFSAISKEIDYEKVHKTIAELRKDSHEYLKSALEVVPSKQ